MLLELFLAGSYSARSGGICSLVSGESLTFSAAVSPCSGRMDPVPLMGASLAVILETRSLCFSKDRLGR